MQPLHCKLSQALLITLLLTVAIHAENLSVDCQKGQEKSAEFTTISAAVAKIAQKAAHEALGPNTITVSGPCVENVAIISLDNLTLQASPKGASISDASKGTVETLAVIDSNRFALNGFTINGGVNCAGNSVCRVSGNTIQNSQIFYGLRASHAHVDSQNDSISNNPGGAGLVVTNQSRVLLQDDTVSNNGGHGIQVFVGSMVQLTAINSTTTVSNNAGHGIFALNHGTVRLHVANITGNGGDGIRV